MTSQNAWKQTNSKDMGSARENLKAGSFGAVSIILGSWYYRSHFDKYLTQNLLKKNNFMRKCKFTIFYL